MRRMYIYAPEASSGEGLSVFGCLTFKEVLVLHLSDCESSSFINNVHERRTYWPLSNLPPESDGQRYFGLAILVAEQPEYMPLRERKKDEPMIF